MPFLSKLRPGRSFTIGTSRALTRFRAIQTHLVALTVSFETSALLASAALPMALGSFFELRLESMRVPLFDLDAALGDFFFVLAVVPAALTAAVRSAALAGGETFTVEFDAFCLGTGAFLGLLCFHGRQLAYFFFYLVQHVAS